MRKAFAQVQNLKMGQATVPRQSLQGGEGVVQVHSLKVGQAIVQVQSPTGRHSTDAGTLRGVGGGDEVAQGQNIKTKKITQVRSWEGRVWRWVGATAQVHSLKGTHSTGTQPSRGPCTNSEPGGRRPKAGEDFAQLWSLKRTLRMLVA